MTDGHDDELLSADDGHDHDGDGTEPVADHAGDGVGPWAEATDEAAAWFPPDDAEPWPPDLDAGDEEPGALVPADDAGDAITLAADHELLGNPLADLLAAEAPDDVSDGGGAGPIDLSDDPGASDDGPPPPGLADEPPWGLVPSDNGAVGSAALGLALAGLDLGALPDEESAADAPATVAVLEALGATARVEHGALDDLTSCLERGGTVLLTGTDGGPGRPALALVSVDAQRGVVVVRPAEAGSVPVEVPVARFQQAWDDTAAQMVVAGEDGGTVLLPVTLAAGTP